MESSTGMSHIAMYVRNHLNNKNECNVLSVTILPLLIKERFFGWAWWLRSIYIVGVLKRTTDIVALNGDNCFGYKYVAEIFPCKAAEYSSDWLNLLQAT